jgi:SRSO17 transposase
VTDLRSFVVERLGGLATGVLIADETGYPKKGICSAGVQRQYTGTADRIENSQVGVFLSYASRHGRVLADARLYVPARGSPTPPGAPRPASRPIWTSRPNRSWRCR